MVAMATGRVNIPARDQKAPRCISPCEHAPTFLFSKVLVRNVGAFAVPGGFFWLKGSGK
jgi:hypothetical protein